MKNRDKSVKKVINVAKFEHIYFKSTH